MKIKKITLHNIGPFVGENSFHFNTVDKNRNIVLIGGKNGAGKTTLFNSIKICLYGSRAFGFNTKNQFYIEEVTKIINTAEKLNPVGKAGITTELVMDDGKYDHIYTLKRSWTISKKNFREKFQVYKNDTLLSESEKQDFESYLLQLIPPDMFKFYFFDGEKISDFVFSGRKDTDFKQAFLKLCGLDTIEIICENFQRISRHRLKDESGVAQTYESFVSEKKRLNSEIDQNTKHRADLAREAVSLDEELARLKQEYAKNGGVSQAQWQQLQDQLNREEFMRNETRKWLKDTANNVLPFVILKRELQALKEQLFQEQSIQNHTAVEEVLQNDCVQQALIRLFRSQNIALPEHLAARAIGEIAAQTNVKKGSEAYLMLSRNELTELIGKINQLSAFEPSKIKEATDEIASSLQRTKKIRSEIERCSADNYESFLKVQNQLLEKKTNVMADIIEAERTASELSEQLTKLDAGLKKARTQYEAVLKEKSVNEISAKALLAFEELQSKLYYKFIREIEKHFQSNFMALINKPDLLDGIIVDEDLNVIPYKNQTFNIPELSALLDHSGPAYLMSQIGGAAFDKFCKLKDTSSGTVILPVEVKQQLSAGEKQIFIMSLYQSLSMLNKITVPYIIDTPFARIDGEHRQNILEKFFMQLKGQVIILSTDEEIVGQYAKMISGTLANQYVLNHLENGSTQIIANTYFGGQI